MTAQRTIRFAASTRAYDVHVGSSILRTLGVRTHEVLPGASRVLLVADAGVERTLLQPALVSLIASGIDAWSIVLAPSEPDKSLATLERVLAEMTRLKLERAHALIALGGGIVGDVSGFAAASYRRGLAWINCPTTLLSMVDASVGGKTGINLRVENSLKKNMVGAFHQPTLVLADVDALSTLAPRVFRAGLAECVKHAMISSDWGDPGLGEWLINAADRILANDPETLIELVARNVAIKARVVETDEREELPDTASGTGGGRALLNLGHTFGHAIETLASLSPDGNPSNAPLQHGEAVALGLVAASATAAHPDLAMVSSGFVLSTIETLKRFHLPTSVNGLPATQRLIELMGDDKKVASGMLRLVLPSGKGKATVVRNPPLQAVLAGLDAIRGENGSGI